MIFLYVVKRGKKFCFSFIPFDDRYATLTMLFSFYFPQLSLLRAYFFRITPSLSSSFLNVNLFR